MRPRHRACTNLWEVRRAFASAASGWSASVAWRAPGPYAWSAVRSTTEALTAARLHASNVGRSITDGHALARQPADAAFPLDSGRVVAGRKPLVSVDTKFKFACTSCGACCRSYSETVLVDPFDVWRMNSVAPEAASRLNSAVKRVVARMDTRSLPSGTPLDTKVLEAAFTSERHMQASLFTAGWDASGVSAYGDVPLLFLSPIVHTHASAPRPHDASDQQLDSGHNTGAMHSSITRATSTKTLPQIRSLARGDERLCGFAVPHGTGTAVRCSLGPAGMPTTCALYPLGVFLRTGPQSDDAVFSLDAESCEGVVKPDGGVAVQHAATAAVHDGDVRQYLAPRSLPERLDYANWFTALAVSVASVRLVERLRSAASALVNTAAHAVMYGCSLPTADDIAQHNRKAFDVGSAFLDELYAAWYDVGAVTSDELRQCLHARTVHVVQRQSAALQRIVSTTHAIDAAVCTARRQGRVPATVNPWSAADQWASRRLRAEMRT